LPHEPCSDTGNQTSTQRRSTIKRGPRHGLRRSGSNQTIYTNMCSMEYCLSILSLMSLSNPFYHKNK
jgi:hypothetical protein